MKKNIAAAVGKVESPKRCDQRKGRRCERRPERFLSLLERIILNPAPEPASEPKQSYKRIAKPARLPTPPPKIEPKKNEAKVRAGRAGRKVRWERMLDRHRRVATMRDGVYGSHWKVNLQNLGLRVILSWHVYGRPKADNINFKSMVALEGWPEAAQAEIRKLAEDCKASLPLAITCVVTPSRVKANWRYAAIDYYMRLTAEEKATLEAEKPQPQPKKRDIRRAHVSRALEKLHARFNHPSIRQVQRYIEQEYGMRMALETVRRHMHALETLFRKK